MTFLKTLSLCNFRNYKNESLTFSPKVNIFVGKNGQGKTNCLEAIGVFISGKSFRSKMMKDLICHGESEFIIETTFEKNGIEHDLKIQYSQTQKRLFYNQTSYSTFLPLIGALKGVLFAGFFDELIKGSPLIRRRFLDLQNSQVDPLYLQHLSRYRKALKERNFLLREKKWHSLEIYEKLMCESIPYLIQKRVESLDSLNKDLAQIHHSLTNLNEKTEILYKTPFANEINICEALLKESRGKDQKVGYTQIGPHKDEIEILLKDKSAKKFASEGQMQTLMTAIYLAEYKRLEKELLRPPIFCLDDLGQNLDPERQKKLLYHLDQMGQVFITTPHLPNYTFSSNCRIFEIDDGRIQVIE